MAKVMFTMKGSNPGQAARCKVTRQGFRPGRHYEHTVDALALRADEGRGNAAISVREARAADERTISE
jgi:hypothetical protein